MHPAGPHDEMQAGGEQHRDQHVDAEHQHIGRGPGQERQREQHEQHDGAEDDQRARSRADRRLERSGTAYRDLRTPEQALRPGDQHHGHDQELGDQRQLGEIHGKSAEGDQPNADAQRLDLGDEHGGDIRSDNRAHAADHDHDEGIGDHREIHAEIRRLAGELQRAAKPGEQRAQGKDSGEQDRLIDAERAEHLAIFGRGANQTAETGPREYGVQHAQHQRRDDDQEGVVTRQLPPEDLDSAAQTRRARPEQILRPP